MSTLERRKERLEQVRTEICQGICSNEEMELLKYEEYELELEIDTLEQEICNEAQETV